MHLPSPSTFIADSISQNRCDSGNQAQQKKRILPVRSKSSCNDDEHCSRYKHPRKYERLQKSDNKNNKVSEWPQRLKIWQKTVKWMHRQVVYLIRLRNKKSINVYLY